MAVSVIAAILYFAPLYLSGLAASWEILVFLLGIILLVLELLVIPGFGIAGILGLICFFGGLLLALLNNTDFDFSGFRSIVSHEDQSLSWGIAGNCTFIIVLDETYRAQGIVL